MAEGAALLLASALAVHWAWELMRPLLPVLLVGFVVVAVIAAWMARHQRF